MSQIPGRNGWTIAAQAGDHAPDKTRRLLSRAVRDTFAAIGVVRRFAVDGLDEAARKTGRGLTVGEIDETGQVKAGSRTSGVKRQYLGCVGKVANGTSSVHLSYVREGAGHALIGAREWIPAGHIEDPAISRSLSTVFRSHLIKVRGLYPNLRTLAPGDHIRFVCGRAAGRVRERDDCHERPPALM